MFVGGHNLCHWPLFTDMQTPYEARRILYPKRVYLFITSSSFAGSRPSTAYCTLSPAGVLELFTEDNDFQTHTGRGWLSSWMNCFFLGYHLNAEKTDGFHLMEWTATPELENHTETEQFTTWTWYQVIRWTLWWWTVNKLLHEENDFMHLYGWMFLWST